MRPMDWRFWSALFVATIFLGCAAAFLGYSAAADQCDSALDPEAAIADCSRSIKSGKPKGRDLAAYYNNRAVAYRARGDNDRAIADLNEAIRLDPKLAMAFNNRGNAYNAKGDNDRAIADFNETIRLDPKLARAFQNRGSTYHDKGDNDRAIVDYNEAIRLEPKHAKAFLGRGIGFGAKGDNNRAIADYSEAIRIDPEDASFFNSRGSAYRARGDHDRAVADYNAAIRLDPKSVKAFVGRGVTYHAKGDLDRAITDYNEATRLNPKSPLAYFARGRSYLLAGSAEKALADLTQASAHAPDNAYLALWVEIASQRNNLPSRLAQTSSGVDMNVWPAPVIRLFMGQITPAAALAAADHRDASRKRGQVCEANFYSGELSLTKGSKDEATRLFRLAASDCPRSFHEWEAANAELKALGVVP